MIHLIAAIGLHGQIGLNGKVPWHGLPQYAEQTRLDLAEFSRLTGGGTMVMGRVTAGSLPLTLLRSGNLEGNRRLAVWHRNDDPAQFLSGLVRPIWICGGQKVYEIFIPYVDWHHISVIPYDGPADRFFPPILPNWKTT